MHIVNAALLVGGVIPFATFSWAVRGHFRPHGETPTGMKWTSAVSLAFFAWFVWRLFGPSIAAAWPVALALFIGSMMVFGWAVRSTQKDRPTLAFTEDAPSFLLHDGPYRYVRHPFYLSYLMFWLGTALATTGVWPWLVPLLMLAIYAHAAKREEQKFARSDLAAAYRAYCVKAGMFLPRPSSLLTS